MPSLVRKLCAFLVGDVAYMSTTENKISHFTPTLDINSDFVTTKSLVLSVIKQLADHP